MTASRFRRSEWEARIADLKFTLYFLRKNSLVISGLIMASFFIILALIANYIIDPSLAYEFDISRKLIWNNPIINFGTSSTISYTNEIFLLGTDIYGRDLLKMIILAIPLDMYVAFIITVGAAIFGVLLGAIAGYAGGKIDEILLRITDIFLAFPGIVLALVFAAMFGRTIENVMLAVLLVWWPPYVRLMRAQVLSEKEKLYVEALKALGASPFRILFKHILPNSIYPILVQMTLDYGGVILTFSALMFLGFSPSPALPELGNLASQGYFHIFDAPWLLIFPGLVIVVIALAFNLVGDGLRDALDPRLRR